MKWIKKRKGKTKIWKVKQARKKGKGLEGKVREGKEEYINEKTDKEREGREEKILYRLKKKGKGLKDEMKVRERKSMWSYIEV